MGMVMFMITMFFIIGSFVEKVDRWVIAGMTGSIAVVLVISYLRF